MLRLLLTLIFLRPFISSLAFPYANALYSVLLLLILIIWVIFKKVSLEKIQTLKYPLLLFCFALVISVVFSPAKFTSFIELYNYLSSLLLLLIAASLTTEDKLRLINTIILAGLVISLLAIYQYFFGFRHLLDYTIKQRIFDPFISDFISRRRVFFPFITPNTLAGYLAMIIPLTLISKYRTWLIPFFCIAFLLTKSVSAFLALFFASGLYFYLQGRLNKKTILLFIGLLIILSLTFMIRSAHPKIQYQPIYSTLMRLNYWRETLRIIKAHPFTGTGLGNFDLIQSRYAHNSYLQFWAETGILGIAGWLWIILESFKMGFKNLGSVTRGKYIIIGLISSTAAFLLHNLIDFSFFLPEVSLVWWVVLGLML